MDENMTLTDTASDIAIEGTESVDTEAQQETVQSATSDGGEVDTGDNTNSQADADDGATGDAEAADGAAETDEPFLTTRYNHEVKKLNREEAEDLVQIGMHSKAHLDRLRYFAALSGGESMKSALDRLITAQENVIRADISKKVSDPDLVETLVASKLKEFKEKAGQQEQAEKEAHNAEGDNINRRLASEFVDLQKDFPDITAFDALPKSVRREAAEGSIPLKYAYALHLQREQAKINAAAKAAKSAASASTGSGKSDAADGTNPDIAQMKNAIWGE